LNTKNALVIIREEDLDAINDEIQANLPPVDNGVEKGEASVSPYPLTSVS